MWVNTGHYIEHPASVITEPVSVIHRKAQHGMDYRHEGGKDGRECMPTSTFARGVDRCEWASVPRTHCLNNDCRYN